MSNRFERATSAYIALSARCIEWLGMAALGCMVAVNAYNIFRRFFTGDDMAWVQEISPMMSMILYFLAYALIAKDERYVRIEFLVHKLSSAGRAAAVIFARLAVLLFQGILLYLAFKQALFVRIFHTTVLEWPETIYYVPLVVGSADILLTEAIYLWRGLTGRPNLAAPRLAIGAIDLT